MKSPGLFLNLFQLVLFHDTHRVNLLKRRSFGEELAKLTSSLGVYCQQRGLAGGLSSWISYAQINLFYFVFRLKIKPISLHIYSRLVIAGSSSRSSVSSLLLAAALASRLFRK